MKVWKAYAVILHPDSRELELAIVENIEAPDEEGVIYKVSELAHGKGGLKYKPVGTFLIIPVEEFMLEEKSEVPKEDDWTPKAKKKVEK